MTAVTSQPTRIDAEGSVKNETVTPTTVPHTMATVTPTPVEAADTRAQSFEPLMNITSPKPNRHRADHLHGQVRNGKPGCQDAVRERAATIDRGGCAAARSGHSVIARPKRRGVSPQHLSEAPLIVSHDLKRS